MVSAKVVVKERAIEDEEMPVQGKLSFLSPPPLTTKRWFAAESRKHSRQSKVILSDDEASGDKTTAAPAPAPAPSSTPEAANTTGAAAPVAHGGEPAPTANKAKPANRTDPAAEWAQWKEGESVPYSFVAKVTANNICTFCQLFLRKRS